MRDYDVIVVGGGINGLTTAAYLARAGLSVAVFEARGQCGANCDTVELGLPGFLHNTHACWLVPSISPAMADLDLEGHGLDLRGTSVLFAKPFLDGRNVLQALDGAQTQASLERISPRDARVREIISTHAVEEAGESLAVGRASQYGPPTPAVRRRVMEQHARLLAKLDLPITAEDLHRMTGLEVLDLLYESEEARTIVAGLGEYTGQWPTHRGTGPNVLGQAGLGLTPIHTARGGSHALTHALVKAFVAAGGDVWTTCPVERIVVEGGRAVGVRLSPDALFPGEEVRARVVVSNLTFTPTFLGLLGEEVIGPDWAARASRFSYDEPQLLGVYYALSGDVEFASAAHDPGIQRCWVGYLGGETLDRMRAAFSALATGVIPDEPGVGWFLPTRADPTQAPPGCHTAFLWTGVPPCPRRWRGRRLDGWDSWPEVAEPLADAVTEQTERYAPGFSDLVIERHVLTPADMEANNPTAVRANMCGGSPIPEQMGENRPLPGVIREGVSRTFVPGLYLSNSIHPYGATHLACGYLAADEVARDLGCRDVDWWCSEPFDWYITNLGRIPLDLGVGERWRAEPAGVAS
ncbi:MAG: NAD(P)/FAD-dependent oxidoreductase [Acidimicrobiia bacterium]|nr:NAD(P)/FAD-dependent oxidoreductase [Acidimicrobiia bacterium]